MRNKKICVGGEWRRLAPYLAVIALLGFAAIVLSHAPSTEMAKGAGIVQELPEQVGEWSGQDVFYCQNKDCLCSFPAHELDDKSHCPSCAGPLRQNWSPAEAWLLPEDTVLLKKRYSHTTGRQLSVAVVVSGNERVSIHRPQICLTGQGFDIVRAKPLSVDQDGSNPLQLTLLEIMKQGAQGHPGGRPMFYAYWFSTQSLETPSHLVRMWHMAVDRLIHGRARQWAYIAVSGTLRPGPETLDLQACDFVRRLHALLADERGEDSLSQRQGERGEW